MSTEAPDTIRQALAGYDAQTLAAWLVDLNCLLWPADFPLPPPPGWAAAPRGRMRYRLAAPVYTVIRQLITAEDFSRAWWTLKLQRSVDEWAAWWDEQGQRSAESLWALQQEEREREALCS